MRPIRIIAATFMALAILAALVSTATAGRLSTSSSTFRSRFARWDFAGGFGTFECALTLEGSLHSRTITKTRGLLIGYITRAIVGTCPRGSATILTASLPWNVRYEAFTGTLPNINSLVTLVENMQFRIREPLFGVQCLTLANQRSTNTYTREGGGNLTSATIGGEAETDCGIPGTLSGRSTALTVLGAATLIRLTLI